MVTVEEVALGAMSQPALHLGSSVVLSLEKEFQYSDA